MRLMFWFLILYIYIYIYIYACDWIIIIIIILISWFVIFNLLFLNEVWWLCIYAMLWQDWIFFNNERWGYDIHAIRKLGLEWDSLESGCHIFLGRRGFFCGSPRLHIKKKWMITTIYFLLGENIHAWESSKERRLSLGIHGLPLTIGD